MWVVVPVLCGGADQGITVPSREQGLIEADDILNHWDDISFCYIEQWDDNSGMLIYREEIYK